MKIRNCVAGLIRGRLFGCTAVSTPGQRSHNFPRKTQYRLNIAWHRQRIYRPGRQHAFC